MDIAKHTTDYILDEDRSWLGSAHGTDATRTGTLDVSTLTSGTHFTAGGGLVKSGTAVGLNGSSGLWQPYSSQAAVSEIQTVTEGGSGLTSFTLTFDGETTGSIAAAATAATVQTALEGLSNLNPGDVTVTGSAGGPYSVAFAGTRAGTNVPAMTATPTGGSGTVTIATGTGGAAGTFTALGLLFDSVFVTATTAADAPVAILEQGFVVEASLPTNHGVDAAFKTAAPLIHFR